MKAAFPAATIIRPATMFGYEDKLLNNMAGKKLKYLLMICPNDLTVWPIWWKLNHGQTKIRPVHVGGVTSYLIH